MRFTYFIPLSLVASTSAFCPSSNNRPIYAPTTTTTSQNTGSSTQVFAKKKKPKKKGKDQAKSGFEWATSFSIKPYESQSSRDLVSTALASYEGRKGKPLCEEIVGVPDIPKALWRASTAVLVIGQPTEDGAAAEINYANLAALEMVGLTAETFDRLITMPGPKGDNDPDGSVTKIVMNLPSEMKDKAYASGYSKKVLKKGDGQQEGGGHDIVMMDAERWKLEKSALVDGAFVTAQLGVVYAWKEWVMDDTTVCTPGGVQREVINVEDLQGAVDQQAGVIRDLKEGQGLGNKDPQVQEAVAELLRLKALLEASQ